MNSWDPHQNKCDVPEPAKAAPIKPKANAAPMVKDVPVPEPCAQTPLVMKKAPSQIDIKGRPEEETPADVTKAAASGTLLLLAPRPPPQKPLQEK